MNAGLLITGISQLVTPEGAGAKHGKAMRDVRVVERAAIACSGEQILWAGSAFEWTGNAAKTIDV